MILKKPLRYINNIPVYIESDDYVENYETIAGILFESLESGQGNPWGKDESESHQQFVEILNRYLDGNTVMLDAAIGYGSLYNYIPVPDNCYGVDISLTLLQYVAKKHGNINLACARVENLPYRDAVFDIVCAKDILEHVFDLYGTVRELSRVLKPGGHLLVQCPYNQNMEYHYREQKRFKYVHLRTLDEWNLLLLFERIFNYKCLEYNIVLQDTERPEINMLLKKL